MCYAREYYRILDDVQLKLYFLPLVPLIATLDLKSSNNSIFLKHTVLKLLLENS